MVKFSKSMSHVSDVNQNMRDASELRDLLWNTAYVKKTANGTLDYSANVEISVRTAIDAYYALDLLIDMLSSKELK